MDKAKKMAEQAQAKLDEAQKQFNERPGRPSRERRRSVEYDKHGRPIRSRRRRPPPDARRPRGDPPPPPARRRRRAPPRRRPARRRGPRRRARPARADPPPAGDAAGDRNGSLRAAEAPSGDPLAG